MDVFWRYSRALHNLFGTWVLCERFVLLIPLNTEYVEWW
jgi:hypothetical protein